MKKEIVNIALLISGSGSTARAVIVEAQKNNLAINPSVVIADRKAEGLSKANQLGIPTHLVAREKFKNKEEFGDALLALLINQYGVDFIMQCGWLSYTPKNVIEKFSKSIINQHPAPLDGIKSDFGGKGMYGERAIAARLLYLSLCCKEFGFSAEELWTEATTHFVTPVVDGGTLIRVERLDLTQILPEETLMLLANDDDLLIQFSQKIQKPLLILEHHNVIDTLRMVANGQSLGFERDKPLIVDNRIDILEEAKGKINKLYSKK